MIFDGRNGGTVELLDIVLIIRRKGVASFLTQGLKGEKRIPYSSITSVQFKEAGFTTGYIQFGISGGIESGRGVWDATTDENTVLFTKEAADDFRRLRDVVEDRAVGSRGGGISSAPVLNSNIADELTRLADLRDRGVLTEDEFAQQKARLLGVGSANAQAPIPPDNRGSSNPVRNITRSQYNAPPAANEKKRSSKAGKVVGIGCLAVIGFLVFLGVLGSQLR